MRMYIYIWPVIQLLLQLLAPRSGGMTFRSGYGFTVFLHRFQIGMVLHGFGTFGFGLPRIIRGAFCGQFPDHFLFRGLRRQEWDSPPKGNTIGRR